MAKGKSKYVSFAAQREQCRLNKFTYTEKCDCGIVSLMCNYPFDDPKHKKGMCRANTCTDMRKTLAEDVDAILSEEPVKDEADVVAAVEEAEPHKEPAIDEQDYAKEEDPKGAVRAE